MSQTQFDVIVIGAGMSGSWAAKEFCEKGFKTLLLERGKNVRHVKDYPTANLYPWDLKHRGRLSFEVIKENPVASKCYAFREDTLHFFVKDKEHPYVQQKPFDWIRGYQVGGKSLMWARQTQRWSKYDFEGPGRDGFAVDWPIRYDDLAPYYSLVEQFVGISGNRDGLDTLPDGEFLPAYDLNCLEAHFKGEVQKHYPNRHVIKARCAHLSQPTALHLEQGRGQCLSRLLCERGCPFGAYFSANAVTIPWAQKTGNLTLVTDTVVESIVYDAEKKAATGVNVIDEKSGKRSFYQAKIIFVNAGTLNSNLILLNSKSERFPNGLGNDSGTLGKYVAFHNYRAHASAMFPGFKDVAVEGRKPSGIYMPRFKNVDSHQEKFKRGYAIDFYMYRSLINDDAAVGDELVKAMTLEKNYGPWRAGAQMMGETLPKESNFVSLHPQLKDKWGIPQLNISMDYDDNDEAMIADFFKEIRSMFTKAGFQNIDTSDSHQNPGLDIHEMGGIRMGKDPNTSMTNQWNQLHACTNVYVTDGACMTSTSTQNPSLTYMAITARAAQHAVEVMKGG
ncbi:MAG: GMC family oxidoreductase [Saprospiraceae bacterium]|nr:GMC family oxidoreductase [Saprospiraceae bacterium]MBK9687385.1 GMC family oxidoreductase [Saprospiraceae bacterium]